MARFKSEFLANYFKRHGVPWRARAIGHIHALSKWGSVFAPLSNLAAGSGLGRWMGEKLLHVDRRRTFPIWTRQTFARRFERRAITPRRPISGSGAPPVPGPGVILFNDTFTNYNHPEVGIAAAEVFDAAGIGVRLAPHVCCGRPMISQGLLDQARGVALANADALYEAAATGARIVFLEPSCLSAVREDGPALLRGEAQRKARVVADACVLFEITWSASGGPGGSTSVAAWSVNGSSARTLPSEGDGPRGVRPRLLSRIPSCSVIGLDAGCCGMAGSFGYAREHYGSPAPSASAGFCSARAMSRHHHLAASGVSCRQQVAHFTGVRAVHPAVLCGRS